MKPTLIIVEDIEAIRVALVNELENSFDIVAAVEGGPEAIEVCNLHRPQLVLMDIVMPRMSGIEATKLIMENNVEPPKIIILSGLEDEGVVFQAMAAGAVDYLVKPVSSDKIKQVLLGYLQEAA